MLHKKTNLIFLLFCILFPLAIASCGISTNNKESSQKLSSSETVFEAVLPNALQDDDVVFFEILDEVTGISLNPTRYEMEKKDDITVFIRLPLVNGSLLKYRYVLRSGNDTIEKTSTGKNIQFRNIYVSRPSIVKDSVFSWGKGNKTEKLGELSGFVYDEKTNLPIADVLVTINGNTTKTGIDGFYEFKNLPIGEFLITAYHPDGEYLPFQQSAVIAQNALTPASFGMDLAKKVQITFEVAVPENTIADAPVRLLGNTYSTGNIFEEIPGGSSIIASRSPIMTHDGNGKYHITLTLSEGTDFRYKYTLGDGFINAEHSANGEFVTRQYIVPKKDSTIRNSVYSWSREQKILPITFFINAPEDTPQNDIVSIQFNPFVWLQPLPAWKTGENTWMFMLYSPFDYIQNSQFRFCRNNMCGYADDALTTGENASGFILNMDEISNTHTISYTIENWEGISDNRYAFEPINQTISQSNLLKSFTFSTHYDPQWKTSFEWGLIDIAISGANSLFISPTWVFSNRDNLLENNFSTNYQISEIEELLAFSKDAGLSLNYYPQPIFENDQQTSYWENAPHTYNWWMDWFDAYSRFIINYAHLADQQHTNYFIIGGSSISPALPGGSLPSGSPSNTPYNFADQWSDLINEIRGIYDGALIFAVEDKYLSKIENFSFIKDVDAVMVELVGAISADMSPEKGELINRAAQLLDTQLIKVPELYGKPIILGLSYTSLDGSASNCVNHQLNCNELLRTQNTDLPSVDLDEQADIYYAFLSESIKRDWIIGINSLEFQPSVVVQDGSASVRGKPAFDVVSYFYNQIIK